MGVLTTGNPARERLQNLQPRAASGIEGNCQDLGLGEVGLDIRDVADDLDARNVGQMPLPRKLGIVPRSASGPPGIDHASRGSNSRARKTAALMFGPQDMLPR